MLISSALTDDLPFGFLHFLVIGSYFTVPHPLTRLYLCYQGYHVGDGKKALEHILPCIPSMLTLYLIIEIDTIVSLI